MVEQSTVTRSCILVNMAQEKRTYADRREYIKQAVIRRRKKLIDQSVAYKGGCCAVCGYKKCNRALTFHHIDPNTKGFGISQKGITRSWERIRTEIDKCVLVCANCHAEIHDGITQLSGEIQK